MTVQLSKRSIVVIEDSDEDYGVTEWALKEAGISNPIHRCADAASIDELLDMRSAWPHALAASYPFLILLDLNVPGTDWRKTLHRLRHHPYWQPIPVVVISTSKHPNDLADCYGLGAAGYLVKLLDLDAFAAAMQRLIAYWLETVTLPDPTGLPTIERPTARN